MGIIDFCKKCIWMKWSPRKRKASERNENIDLAAKVWKGKVMHI